MSQTHELRSHKPRLRERPLIELFLLATMFVVDRFVLRRWLPPLGSALGSAVVVTIAFMPFLLRSRGSRAKRLIFLLVIATLVVCVLSLVMK